MQPMTLGHQKRESQIRSDKSHQSREEYTPGRSCGAARRGLFRSQNICLLSLQVDHACPATWKLSGVGLEEARLQLQQQSVAAAEEGEQVRDMSFQFMSGRSLWSA